MVCIALLVSCLTWYEHLIFFRQVYYRPDKSYQVTDPSYNSSEQSVRTVSTQVTLSGLYPASTYTVYIRSVNAVGTGAASTSVTVVLSPAGQG